MSTRQECHGLPSGPMIAAWGVVPSIAVNCFAFLYASFTMYLLVLDPSIRRAQRTSGSLLHDAVDGVRYVVRHPGIGPMMLYAASVGLLCRAVPEMLPPYVAELFGRGADGLASLASAVSSIDLKRANRAPKSLVGNTYQLDKALKLESVVKIQAMKRAVRKTPRK